MTALTVELPPEVYRRLLEEAERLGTGAEVIVQEWVAQRLAPLSGHTSEREKAREVLRSAGLLTELGPDLLKVADTAVSLEEVQESLARAGGTPLSEIVLEQRGPKE